MRVQVGLSRPGPRALAAMVLAGQYGATGIAVCPDRAAERIVGWATTKSS